MINTTMRLLSILSFWSFIAAAQDDPTSTTLITSTVFGTITASSSQVSSTDLTAYCFARTGLTFPTGEPEFPDLPETVSLCDIYGPSPVPSLGSLLSSWNSAYFTWFDENSIALSSYYSAVVSIQATAATQSQCAPLYTSLDNILSFEFSGTVFPSDYVLKPESYYSSLCSASLASERTSSHMSITSTTSSSSRATSSTRASITTFTASSSATPAVQSIDSTAHTTITYGTTASSSPTGASNRMMPHSCLLYGMASFVIILIQSLMAPH